MKKSARNSLITYETPAVQTVVSTETDNYVYYNVIITNNQRVPIEAKYSETRSEGILTNPSDYYLSVIRATIPTDTLPLFAFEPIYTITLVDTVGDPWEYDLEYLDLDPMYNDTNVYSIQQFLSMINNALTTAFNAAIDGGNMGSATTAPYMVFDPSTQLISMYVETAYASDNIGIYFNALLYDFFGNFEAILYGYDLPDGLDVRFLVQDNRNPNTKPVTGFYQLQQEYPVSSLFYSARSIQFTTGNIPINPEFIPATQSIVGSNASAANNSRQIITDIEFPLGEAIINVKPYLQYNASSLYRMIDLNSTSPLRTIDIQVAYVDDLGNTFPLLIAPNDSLTMKLMFVKKSIWNSNQTV